MNKLDDSVPPTSPVPLSFNCQAGTTIDEGLGHPTAFDYYQLARGGLLGTSRPAHYSVIYDENHFNADSMQNLSLALCQGRLHPRSRLQWGGHIHLPAPFTRGAGLRFGVGPGDDMGMGMIMRGRDLLAIPTKETMEALAPGCQMRSGLMPCPRPSTKLEVEQFVRDTMSTPSLNQINSLARKKILSAKDGPIHSKTRQAIQDLFATPEQRQIIDEEINNLIANLVSRVSPSSRKKRAAAEKKWEWMVLSLEPDLPLDQLWDKEIVMKYYKYMLPVLLKTSKGTRGREYVKASTLQQYMELFVWAIARNTRDRDGNKCGSRMLSGEGLLFELDNILHTLTIQHDLSRNQDVKLYYGEHELKLLVQELIGMSAKSGRLGALQKLCMVLTLFYTTVRPGSLAPSDSEYEAQGKFPTLENLKILRLGFMTFKVELELNNFKGSNTTSNALERKYVFEPVVQWYNVHLDISLYYVAFMLARGALQGISTVDDLRKTNKFELKIKDSMLDQPLFLKFKFGGKHFSEDLLPIDAEGISRVIQVATKNAGMAPATCYCFRRGSGNVMAIIVGKESTEDLLTHKPAGSLHFYSENTANIDIVGARLDEMPIPMDANKRHLLDRKIPTSRAVQAVVYLTKSSSRMWEGDEDQDSSDDDTPSQAKLPRNTRSSNIQLTIEQKMEAESGSKECKDLAARIELKWKEFMACYPNITTHGKSYKIALSSIKGIRRIHGSKLLVPVEDVDKIVDELRVLFQAQVNVKRALYRKIKEAMERKILEARKTSLDGTVDQINNAVQDLLSKTPLLIKAPNMVAPLPFTASPQMLSNRSAPKSVAETARTSQRPAEASTTFISYSRPSNHSAPVPVAGPSDAGFMPPDSSSANIDLDAPIFQSMIQVVKGNSDQLDENEDDEPDDGVATLTNKLNSLGGNKQAPRLEDPAKPCSITDTEPKDVNAPDGLETPNVRSALVDLLIGPIVIEKAFSNLEATPDGRFHCPRCVNFFHHRPKLQAKTYTSTRSVRRHFTVQHTSWKELVLLMIQKNSKKYHCPLGRPTCTFIGDTEDEVLEHCIEECSAKDKFEEMWKEHASLVSDETAVVKGNVTVAKRRQWLLKQRGASAEQDWVKTLREESPRAYTSMLDDVTNIQNHVGPVVGATMEQFEKAVGLSIVDLYKQYELA